MEITRTRKQNCNRVRSSYKIKTPSFFQRYRDEWEITPARDPVEIIEGVRECMVELRKSKSYQAFDKQINKQGFRSKMKKVLGKEKKFQMVIYGLGNISLFHTSKIQLAFALMLKGNNDWIGEIQVFDPLFKFLDIIALKELGCTVLQVNEEGKRKADVPTLAFMPHCRPFLYNNLLQANWNSNLNNLVILGNSFLYYKRQLDKKRDLTEENTSADTTYTRYIFQSQKMYLVEEMSIGSLSKEFFDPFSLTSWHFFTVHPACLPLKAP